MELPPDDPWVSRGYRLVPEDYVGDQGRDSHESNLRDVHRPYAQVTTADDVVAYLRGASVFA